mmetsp:Transcript_1173/g.1766  ORF Transcript_1173/g.1766 Transcript_1173/m.1766 type:complete len:242 (-) Transcript_1173:1197-1922(-)
MIPSLKPSIFSILPLLVCLCVTISSIFLAIVFIFVFLAFSLLLNDGCLEGCGFGAILVLLWVIHDRGRVHWERLLLVAELVTMAKVDLCGLTIVEEGVAAWPDEGSHDDHGIRLRCRDRGVLMQILCGVAAEAHRPARLFEFLTDQDGLVRSDLLQQSHIRVGFLLLSLGLLRVELFALGQVGGLLGGQVRDTSIYENVRLGVHPHFSSAHLTSAWHQERLVFLALIGYDVEQTLSTLVLL